MRGPEACLTAGTFSLKRQSPTIRAALPEQRGTCRNREPKPLLQHEDGRTGDTSQHHQRLMQIGLVLTLSRQEG